VLETIAYAALSLLVTWSLTPPSTTRTELLARLGVATVLTLLFDLGRQLVVFMLWTPRRRHVFLRVLAGSSAVACAVLWWIVGRLPDARGGLLRHLAPGRAPGGGASLGTTVLLVGLVLLPWVLDRLERRGFFSFVAVRHVRATPGAGT
jgi:hypothetical protein